MLKNLKSLKNLGSGFLNAAKGFIQTGGRIRKTVAPTNKEKKAKNLEIADKDLKKAGNIYRFETRKGNIQIILLGAICLIPLASVFAIFPWFLVFLPLFVYVLIAILVVKESFVVLLCEITVIVAPILIAWFFFFESKPFVYDSLISLVGLVCLASGWNLTIRARLKYEEAMRTHSEAVQKNT